MPVRYVCDRCSAPAEVSGDTFDTYEYNTDPQILTQMRDYASKFGASAVIEKPTRPGWLGWARFRLPEGDGWRIVKEGGRLQVRCSACSSL